VQIVAYFGPETFLPLTSVIAGVLGVLLMFGRNTWRVVVDGARRILRLPKAGATQPEPTSTPAGTAGPMSRRARYLNRGKDASVDAGAVSEEERGH
jgi:hypothetical protein